MAVADAAALIDETLNAIVDDEVASLVGVALRDAWTGHRFDEDALRERFAMLAQVEAAS